MPPQLDVRLEQPQENQYQPNVEAKQVHESRADVESYNYLPLDDNHYFKSVRQWPDRVRSGVHKGLITYKKNFPNLEQMQNLLVDPLNYDLRESAIAIAGDKNGIVLYCKHEGCCF